MDSIFMILDNQLKNNDTILVNNSSFLTNITFSINIIFLTNITSSVNIISLTNITY